MRATPALFSLTILVSLIGFSEKAYAACAAPVANVGSIDFQGGVFKYCDGTTWQNLGGAGATTDASLLTSGTLADARLSSNIPLKNAANTFSVGGQQITNTAVGTIPLTIRAAAGQTATLTEWEDSVGTLIYGLAPGGVPTAATDLADKGYVDTSVGNYVLKAGDTMTGNLTLADGATNSASLRFAGSPATGFSASTTNVINVVAGNATRATFHAGGLSSATAGGWNLTYNGITAATPSYAFDGDPNTGLFRPADDVIGFATAGLERLRINASGNVGIGTTNSTSTLEVVSGTNGTLHVYNNNPTANPSSSIMVSNYRNSWGAGDPYIISYAANGLPGSPSPLGTGQMFLSLDGRGFSETGFWDTQASAFVRGIASGPWGGGGSKPSYMSFGTSTSEKMRIGPTGNVGIGTTNPARLLHVNGPMRLQPAALPTGAAGDIAIDSGASNALKYYNGSAWVSIGGGGATNIDGLSDAISNNSSIYFGSGSGASASGAGNIGIGPNAGVSLTTGTRNILMGQDTADTLTTNTDTVAIGFQAMPNIVNGTTNFNTAVGSYAMFNNGAGVGESNTALGYQTLYQTSGSFNVALGKFALYGANGTYNIGLGVGTADGNSGSHNIAMGNISQTNTSGANNITIGRNTFFNNGGAQTANQNVVIGNYAASTNGVRSAANNVIVGYNATPSLTSGSSNVVIGKDAGSTLTTGGANILIGSNTNTPAAGSANFLNIGNAMFGTGLTGTTAAPAGNIGIGTTAPATKLHVTAGDLRLDYGRSIQWNASNNYISVDTDNGMTISSYQAGQPQQGPIMFKDSNSGVERMRISNIGNLGIGTTNPTVKLEVNGPAKLGSDGSAVSLYLSDTIRHTGSGNIYFDYGTGGTTGALQFRRGSSLVDTLVMKGTGEVGIGTTSPGYTLHVVGTAGLSTGTAWTNASDSRLKDIHGDYEYGLAEILKLHTVRYNYKKGNALGLPSDHPMIGFVAQEVQSVIPDAVKKRKDGYLELNVDPIHWASVNAIQELHGMCKATDAKITDHDQRIDALERDLASVKSENADLKARLVKIEELLRAK